MAETKSLPEGLYAGCKLTEVVLKRDDRVDDRPVRLILRAQRRSPAD